MRIYEVKILENWWELQVISKMPKWNERFSENRTLRLIDNFKHVRNAFQRYELQHAINSLIINIQESISILNERVAYSYGSINYRFPLRLRNDLLMVMDVHLRTSRSNFWLGCRDSSPPLACKIYGINFS